MVNNTMDALEWLRKQLDGDENDLLREMVREFAQRLMAAEVDALAGAGWGEVSPERVNHRDGYRQRPFDKRVGSIDLAIPKLRRGLYFPDWLLDPRRRAEKALVAVVAECYVRGVSTRRVDGLVKTLGIESLSKSQVSRMAGELDEMVTELRNRPLDAGPYTYVWMEALIHKVREGGRIINVAVVIAVGVNRDGHREILGLDVITTEGGAGWLAFPRGLVARGLSGTSLVISDAHSGLVDAIASTLVGATWQRCRTHYMRNLLTRVPKSAQSMVATLVNLGAFRSMPDYRGDSPVLPWLLAIARNVCADHVRRRQRQRRLFQRLRDTAVEATVVASAPIEDLLATLDPERREAFVLTQLVGLSYEEAADVVGCPVGTIRSRVARTRADLFGTVRRSGAL